MLRGGIGPDAHQVTLDVPGTVRGRHELMLRDEPPQPGLALPFLFHLNADVVKLLVDTVVIVTIADFILKLAICTRTYTHSVANVIVGQRKHICQRVPASVRPCNGSQE